MIYYTEARLKNCLRLIKGYYFKLYLKFHGCKVGKRLRCGKIPLLRLVPKNNIFIGNNVFFGPNITIEVYPEGKLIISDNVNFTQDILISCCKEIIIGKHTGFAERVSIRDSDHIINSKKLWSIQGITSGSIIIGNDVGIGLGCSIFRGAHIKDGVIIGTNSMVFGNTKTIPYGIYLGNPLKLIGKRVD